MAYALEEIAHALKAARQAKGLSQRALSAKAGLTQAQISKIENAAVDVQLSSLIELARALDLELTLVPRRTVPAVQSIARSASAAAPSPGAIIALHILQEMAGELFTKHPDATALQQIHKAAQALQDLPLTPKQVETLKEAAREAQRIARSLRIKAKEAHLTPEEQEKIRNIGRQLHSLRISIAQALASDQPRPAYRLDEDASDG